jgi:hypothetical protein
MQPAMAKYYNFVKPYSPSWCQQQLDSNPQT